ncbi:MAG TPA: TlpA disulfide reductase family protein [Longimicrobiaceae bacterium]|nr:TlpA disulfide reductase family protein [Longimicrobiaceae bacterium]
MRGLAAAALLVLAACGGEQRPRVPTVGEAAPAYAATTLDGDSVSLQGLRGRVVLLNVWATWCKPCREEIPDLQRLYLANRPRGFEVVGVSVDAAGQEQAVREFVQELGVTYPVWLDPDERVSSTFATLGVPSTFLVGRDGTLLWKKLGPVRADDPELRTLLAGAL